MISKIIRKLKKLPSAISYDSDCSTQVMFKLIGRRYLRLCSVDTDVSTWPHWSIDIYTPFEYHTRGVMILGAGQEGTGTDA